ncbi:inositol-pentakisphosphate 2-kinase-like isoform X2 [Ptychodera flava]|uniref:inositol-pentakisphosphate 2-kinase-like isoform X2 n=1 Tax=Ptychodera flava TaxID=63121 RepID=UPI003969EDAD
MIIPIAESVERWLQRGSHYFDRMELSQLTDEWTYRGEGNASLVIASKDENFVYHLPKQSVDEGKNNENQSGDSDDNLEKFLEYKLDYIENVMMPLIGQEYVCHRELVEISKDFLQQVHQRFQHMRPKSRLSTKVNCNCRFAVKSPDFCQLLDQNSEDDTTFCVEIKPKCGFLPVSDLISEDNSIKKSVCRFCMHQRLKVKEGKWTELSNYCPVDLFSGNSSSMFYALTALLSNPQNNLRIFKDGSLLYGCCNKQPPCKDDCIRLINRLKPHFGNSDDVDETIATSSAVQALKDVIIAVLLSTSVDTDVHEPQQDRKRMKTETPKYKKCSASAFKPQQEFKGDTVCCLPEGCILHSLLQVQKLDGLSIEGIHLCYLRLQRHFMENPSDRKKWKLDGPYSEGFLSKCSCDVPDSFRDDVQKVNEYLVSKTAKDCSIMIALQTVKENTPLKMSFVEDRFGHKFYYKIQLADLDPKPFDRIPKYYEQDKEIVDSFMKETSKGRM